MVLFHFSLFFLVVFFLQHFLSKPEVNTTAIQHQSQGDGRRFRYRTTLADESQHRQQTHRRQQGVNDAWGQREQRRQAHLSSQRNRGVIARERRRYIHVLLFFVFVFLIYSRY